MQKKDHRRKTMSDQDIHSPSRRKFLLGVGAAAGSAAILGSTVPLKRAYGAAPPQVNIGMIAPFTGSAGEFGEFYRDAAKMGIDQVNKAAEDVLGGPVVKLSTADSNTLPQPAIAAAKKLIETKGISALLCAWSSGVTVAVATSATLPSQVLQMGYGTTSPLVSVLPEDKKRDLLFRTSPSDLLQGKVAAQLATGQIIDSRKFKTASTIFINNPYGQGLSDSFSKAFEAMGGKILEKVPHPEKVQPTYKSELATALKGGPDLLFSPDYPSHTAVVFKESRDIFDFTTWQLTDGNKAEEVIKAVGADTMNGTWGTAPGVNKDAAGYKAFKKNYTEKVYHHDHIPPFTSNTYDAGVVLALAVIKAIVKGGVTNADEISGSVIRDQLRPVANPPGEEVTIGSQEGINKAVELIKKGKEINITGASSPVDFDDNGDVVTPYDIFEVKNGDYETSLTWPAKKIPTDLYS
jgi:ABC-type branched-subunit amino acid transport system substrate-binding protein